MTRYRYRGDTKNDPIPETCGDKRGTVTGASRHRKAGEKRCDDCRIAENAYATTWRGKQEGKGRSAKISQRLRQRALVKLRVMHPEDYRRLLDAEWIAETNRQEDPS